ncbi:hypothetical protein E4K72_14715, partial [Oxalobacteraceae bacterium OM1]
APAPAPAPAIAQPPAPAQETTPESARPPLKAERKTPEPKPAEEVAPKTAKASKPTEKPSERSTEKVTAQSDDASLPTLRELPDAMRAQVPALTVAGFIYSPAKADRSVLINNRLLREGDEVAPGLRLEKMTQQWMVLDYRGTRFRHGY